MEVKVIKVNIDLKRLPEAKIFRDSQGKEWVAIPSVDAKEWKENKDAKQEINRNPCKVWAGVNSTTQEEKRIISLDVVPYNGSHSEWGHTHLVKFYRGAISNDVKENNLILGNGKEETYNWKDKTDNVQQTAPAPKPYKQEAPQASSSNENPELPF